MKRVSDISIENYERIYRTKSFYDEIPSLSEVYQILCIPNDSIHQRHYIGSFSTLEKANHFIPACGFSIDSSKCKWNYSINKSIMTDELKSKIDSISSLPKDYPY